MNDSLSNITDVCKRHNEFLKHAPLKQTLKQSTFINESSETERRKRFDEYLHFVYGNHKDTVTKYSQTTDSMVDDVDKDIKPTLNRIKTILKVPDDDDIKRNNHLTKKRVSFTSNEEKKPVDE